MTANALNERNKQKKNMWGEGLEKVPSVKSLWKVKT